MRKSPASILTQPSGICSSSSRLVSSSVVEGSSVLEGGSIRKGIKLRPAQQHTPRKAAPAETVSHSSERTNTPTPPIIPIRTPTIRAGMAVWGTNQEVVSFGEDMNTPRLTKHLPLVGMQWYISRR